MTRLTCPNCGKLLVEPSGRPSSRILFLAEFPGFQEIEENAPWVGPAGDVFKRELQRAGIVYNTCRSTNLWLHGVDTKTCEFKWHLEQAFKELQGKEAVLLIGSEVSKYLLEKPVSEVSGLRVTAPLLPKEIKLAVACFNPAMATKGEGVGEIRLAIERFAAWSAPYRD
jgi:uracil-DNA glycosylase